MQNRVSGQKWSREASPSIERWQDPTSTGRPAKRAKLDEAEQDPEEWDGYEELAEPLDEGLGLVDELADPEETKDELDDQEEADDQVKKEPKPSVSAASGPKGRSNLQLAVKQDPGERNVLAEIKQVGPINPKNEMHMELVEVPKRLIAKVIGKKGSQVRAIRDETGAHIDARNQAQDPVQVKVMGTSEAIAHARRRIEEICADAVKPKEGLLVEVPMNKIGKVIGIRGAQIREIQQTTGAKVDVDKDQDPCKVVIAGTFDQITEAERVVRTLIMEETDVGSEYIDLPSAATGAVLGVKGSRLLELQNQSGARIDVDKSWPATLRVRIAGEPEQIEIAKQLVLFAAETPSVQALPWWEGSATEVLKLPENCAGKVIVRGAPRLKEIQTESGARVWIDIKKSEAQITGPPVAVEVATALVKSLVDEVISVFGLGMLTETGAAKDEPDEEVHLHPKVNPTSAMQLAFAILAAKKWQTGADWD